MKRSLLLLFAFCIAVLANAQMEWYNPMDGEEPFLEGRAWNKELGNASYARMPDRFKGKVSTAVWNLSRHSAGLSIRFYTDSKNIKVQFINTSSSKNLPNVVSLNHSGVDLYAYDVDGNASWVPNNMHYTFSLNSSDTAEFRYDVKEMPVFGKRGTQYELYLPTYNGIKWLRVGVDKGSRFSFVRGSQEKPIVVYGTSIAHGAAASRPGLIWSTMLKRQFDFPFINLGFSGSAKSENIMYDAMSEIDAKMFIIDCIPNCGGVENGEFAARLRYGIKKIREKSNAPILFMDGQTIPGKSTLLHMDYVIQHVKDSVQYAVYSEMKKAGVKDLYYITHEELNLEADDFIEGAHPNDLGMRKYANVYAKHIQQILIGDETMRNYTPCPQRRDNSYEWLSRHNEILELNKTTNPEILMIGNSITHFWGGQPVSRCNGGETWGKLFGKHVAVNMGMGWDRVENVYWRIIHGELDNCCPKQICLMIGTNNIAMDNDEKIVSGIVDIVKLIRKRQPQAKLHVVKVYPRKGKEERVKALNDLLEKTLVCDDHVTIQDVSSCLTLKDGSGKIDPSCFVEGLHPNEKGYAALVKAYKKFLFK